MTNYFERKHKKFEEKYCAKHGREKYLKQVSKYYVLYLILTITWSIFSVTQLLLAISSLHNDDLFLKVLYFIGFGCGIVCAFLWGIQTPFYKKKSKECKNELNRISKTE